MLPSLREERRATYSPFLPISPRTGIVLQVPMVERNDAKAAPSATTIPTPNERVDTPVTGGRVKLQWKPDWAMRWVALGIDYEMAGKDLIDSGQAVGRDLPRARRRRRRRASTTSCSSTRRARRFPSRRATGSPSTNGCAMPRRSGCRCSCIASRGRPSGSTSTSSRGTSTSTSSILDGYQRQDAKQRLSNPVWHIHSGHPPKPDMPITFAMLLTLVSSSNAENAETLWGFIGRYRPGVTPQTHPKLDALVGYAIHYFRDFVLPAKTFREPTEAERAALHRSARRAVAASSRRDAPSKSRTWSTRSAGASRSSIDRQDQDQGRQARRVARLVQHALPGAARAGEGPALRLVRGGLRPEEHGRHDRRRAGALGVSWQSAN